MFFAQFWAWLSVRLDAYIGEHVAAVAAALQPVVVTLATIYVMVWGLAHLRGAIEEPVLTGALRIVRMVAVIAVGVNLWQYHAVIVETFYTAPVALAAEVADAPDPVGTVDALWAHGGQVAATLWAKGGVFDGDLGYYVAATAIYVLMGAVCVYTLFLMALSRVALAVLLAIGPLFIVLLLFDASRRFFEHWIAQLANYALVGVLAVLVASLMLTVVAAYAEQTAALGGNVLTVDTLDMLLVAALVLLILRQVMPIAARLAGGVSLSSQVMVGAIARSGGRAAWRGGGIAMRQAIERARGGVVSMGGGASVATTVTLPPARVRPVWRRSAAGG
jgi:type IV secretion system protein VirB6